MSLYTETNFMPDHNGSAVERSATITSNSLAKSSSPPDNIPAYMHDVYEWAYISPRNVQLLDRNWVVNSILLGNNNKLQHALLSEIIPGQRVLQSANVYGSLIPKLAECVGTAGTLDVIDVVPIQAARCQHKLQDMPQATVRICDARDFHNGQYDLVSCFFLLHEVPDDWKRAIVDNLLGSMAPEGRAVFVDYHGPAWWHPLREIMRPMLKLLEPFALSLWNNEIRTFASTPDHYNWQTETYFGGLYQKTVVTKRAD